MTSNIANNRRSYTTAANDILLTVLLATSIILGLALYVPGAAAGVIGSGLNYFLKGMLGPVALVLPATIFVMSILLLVKRYPIPKLDMLLHGALVLITLSALIHVMTVPLEDIHALSDEVALQAVPPLSTARARDVMTLLWRSGAAPETMGFISGRLPGGVLGGMMGLAFMSLFGKLGATIILLAGLIIEAALLFNFSVSWVFSRTGTILKDAGSKLRDVGIVAAEHVGAGTHTLSTLHQERRQALGRSSDDSASRSSGNWDHAIGGTKEKDPTSSASERLEEPKSKRSEGLNHDLSDTGHVAVGRGIAKKLLSYGNPGEQESHDSEDAGFDGEGVLTPDFFGSEMIPEKRTRKQPRRLFHDMDVRNEDTGEPASPLSQVPYNEHDDDWGDALDEAVLNNQGVELNAKKSNDEVKVVTYDGDATKTVKKPSKEKVASEPSGKDASRSTTKTSEPKTVSAKDVAEDNIKRYRLPPLELLEPRGKAQGMSRDRAALLGEKLEQTLESFGVQARVIHVTTGPTITRFELAPGPGVKVSKIVNLADDIALSLAAVGVRIEAPIPGKSAIGIEISNKETAIVGLRNILEEERASPHKQPLMVALGRDIPGAPTYSDLSKMPHLLIAGATGSGKSICINVILMNILFRAKPDEVKLLLVDPKVVELSIYNGIPHLLAPVVTDPKKAANTLNWAVAEMTRRYGLFAQFRVRDLQSYNQRARERDKEVLPLIVLIIDELSDLMVTSAREVEEAIARLTAMARAAGIHLVIATQRPSVDVITGVIKANMPSRIAFAVTSQVDSRTILDQGGAEKLLGKGDMLYYPQSASKPIRGQGAFVSEDEVETVVGFITAQGIGGYDKEVAEKIVSTTPGGRTEDQVAADKVDEAEDELLNEAVDIVLDAGYASVSILQRRLSVGYPRAARLIDTMEQLGYIGPFEGSKPRKVIITHMEWNLKNAEGEDDINNEEDLPAEFESLSDNETDGTNEALDPDDNAMMEEEERPPFDFV